ncbi:MAG: ParB/RepB/Spo0J family partition protein [Verrucomicrobiae bacterium]|nr:ParB/RepB/Spo0J family partition protein [Verrucomicrobiae bacterium]
MSKQALGRGLGALIPGKPAAGIAPNPVVADAAPGEKIHELEIFRIVPNRFQPRKAFREGEIAELADSIRVHGIIQPLIVIRRGEEYELVAGERRLRASKSLGHDRVPCLVRQASEEQLAELALIENLQRENLSPLEEAEAYQLLLTSFNLRQEDIAAKVGKSRASVANTMRLLELSADLKTLLNEGAISVGHAKVLLGFGTNHKLQLKAAEKIVSEGLNVRQTELLVAAMKGGPSGPTKKTVTLPTSQGGQAAALIQQIQTSLQQKLGTKVHVQHGDKKGSITIEYYGNDDLGRLLEKFGISL